MLQGLASNTKACTLLCPSKGLASHREELGLKETATKTKGFRQRLK